MHWLLLLLAGICEMGWAVAMKYSHGFTRFMPSALTAILMTGSVVLLAIAVKTLPLGTAYAIWTGIGIVGTTIVGMCVFGESTSVLRILSLTLILIGIVGLKLLPSK